MSRDGNPILQPQSDQQPVSHESRRDQKSDQRHARKSPERPLTRCAGLRVRLPGGLFRHNRSVERHHRAANVMFPNIARPTTNAWRITRTAAVTPMATASDGPRPSSSHPASTRVSPSTAAVNPV